VIKGKRPTSFEAKGESSQKPWGDYGQSTGVGRPNTPRDSRKLLKTACKLHRNYRKMQRSEDEPPCVVLNPEFGAQALEGEQWGEAGPNRLFATEPWC